MPGQDLWEQVLPGGSRQVMVLPWWMRRAGCRSVRRAGVGVAAAVVVDAGDCLQQY